MGILPAFFSRGSTASVASAPAPAAPASSTTSFAKKALVYGSIATALGASAIGYYYAPESVQSSVNNLAGNAGNLTLGVLTNPLNETIASVSGGIAAARDTVQQANPLHHFERVSQGAENLDSTYVQNTLFTQTILLVGAVASKAIGSFGKCIKSRTLSWAGKLGFASSVIGLGISAYQYMGNAYNMGAK